MLIGGISGAIAQFVATPFDLLKVQYMTNKTNQNKSIIQSLNSIVNKKGFFGLYRGVGPNIMRALCVNLGELATYDHSKKYIKKSLIKKNQQDYIYFVVDYQDLLLHYVLHQQMF